MIPINRRTVLAVLAACALAAPQVQAADPYPSRPIQLVMPYPPGGAIDSTYRALAEAASRDLGQPVVVINRPGAAGVTGAATLATMNQADGYTISLMHNGVLRAPLLQKLNWDPLKDLTYLTAVAELPVGITVAADAPWQTLAELLADAKKRPGAISWGNAGAISVTRIYGERLARQAGTSFNMVPYKGNNEAFQALIGRHLDVYGDGGFGPQVQGGKARLLATFTRERLKRYNAPTVRELGYDLVLEAVIGLVAPKNLDPKIATRLGAAFRKAAGDPTFLNQLEQFDMLPHVISGEEYFAYAKTQFQRERQMLQDMGFKPE